MSPAMKASQDGVAVLFKSGRSPEWERLSPDHRRAFEQEHVDLMLSVASTQRMQQMQGFRLVAPRHTWKLFWVMEFPTLAGAEAWIDAEIAPPYGRYGFQHYWLARRCTDDPLLHDWNAPLADEDANPHHIPPLEVDRSSFVAVGMARRQPAALDVDDAARGETGRVELLRSIGQQHGILSLQAFRLITPQPDWHVVWIVEFPTLDGVEAWIEAQSRPPHGSYWRVDYYLARRWAPGYVASWVPR